MQLLTLKLTRLPMQLLTLKLTRLLTLMLTLTRPLTLKLTQHPRAILHRMDLTKTPAPTVRTMARTMTSWLIPAHRVFSWQAVQQYCWRWLVRAS